MNAIKVGTLVNWTKKLNNYPESETQTLPAIVNQIWANPNGGNPKDVSLFVFSLDGAMSARSVSVKELEVIADPDQLALLLLTAPGIMRQQAADLMVYGEKIEEAFRRIGELEESITSAQAVKKVSSKG